MGYTHHMMSNKIVKAYGYARVSGQAQVEGDGLRRQRDAIQRCAEAGGYKVERIFAEEGVSGTTEDRPALVQLLMQLGDEAKGVHVVIVEKLDRLARDLMVQEAIVRDFQKQGYVLVSALEGPDLCADDPSRKFIRQIFGAVAEYEKSMLVLKLKAARERKKAIEGKCEGRKAYGETPEEQAIIRRMRALRRRKANRPGSTYQEIADRLNQENIPAKCGGRWNRGQVYRVLQRKILKLSSN
jgi:DNA invertase Pin-like site-specific DNA recombinase